MKINELLKNLISCTKSGLKACGADDWLVAQNYTPAKGNYPKPIILIRVLGTRAAGWQNHIDKINKNTGLLEHIETQQREVLIRFEALKDRNPAKPEEHTAFDVLSKVKMYFNSLAGIRELRSYELNPARISEVYNPEYETPHGVFEFHPYFDVNIYVFDKFISPQAHISAAEVKEIKGI